MAVTRVNDIDLYYEVRGQGDPLLMVMGWEANLAWWSDRLLRGLAEHWRVVVFDNRGAGRTKARGGRYDIAVHARDAVGLLDALGLERAHVFGISMGGMIAQQLACDAPQRVDRLVLGCTTSRPLGNFRLTRGHGRMLTTYLSRGRHGWRGLQFAFRFSRLPDEPAFSEHVAQVEQAPMAAVDSLRQLFGILRFDGSDCLQVIGHPTLVMAGTADLMIPPEQSRRLAEALPNARLVMFDGLGHLFFNQAPEAVARCVNAFLVSPDAAGSERGGGLRGN